MQNRLAGVFPPVLGATVAALLLINGCGGGGGGSSAGGGAIGLSAGGGVTTTTGGGGTTIANGGVPTPTPTPAPGGPAPTPTPAPGGPTPTPTPTPTGAPTPAPTPLSGSSGNPFVRASLFVDPNSFAARQVATYQSQGDTTDANLVQKISSQSTASWADGGDATVPSNVVSYINQMQHQGNTPFLVVYQIPQRDCGGLAAGGSTSAANYQSWIASLVSALGGTHAIVILEPDALAGMDCLSSTDQQTRLQLISGAVSAFKQQGSAVYIDAGNPNWKSVSTMAGRLQQANIQAADGFALNVSNFCSTSSCQTYGDAISSRVGGKHYVIDTSRNGNGPATNGAWCNPPGVALGPQPTTQTSDSLCDAYEWVKYPGTSDGACNLSATSPAGPSWGWWPQYALGLCKGNSP
ncbi:MAG: glycoside hydrolase family 6 protein [Candidatus Xenobia bacterium]